MIVNIKGREITLRFSFRAYMFFEDITGHSFTGSTMAETVTFLYCIILASTDEYDVKFDDFMDAIDDDPNIIINMSEWLTTNDKMSTMLLPKESKKNSVKKK